MNSENSSYWNFTVIITTRNRLIQLQYTLAKLQPFYTKGLRIIICDDGSSDNTYGFIKKHCPEVETFRNEKSRGLIYSRNKLMKKVHTAYAISLDDDANFFGLNPFPLISNYFSAHPECAVIAFRIYWGRKVPANVKTQEKPERVKSFVGCGHVWRMTAWHDIPDYPEWFNFYGEEEFASYQLFKKDWEVHYSPQILVHHRVNVKERKQNDDYLIRLRQSLRAGWYLYFMFLPLKMIPRKIAYSVWMQLKLKVFREDIQALKALLLAFGDLISNSKKISVNSNRLSKVEYQRYSLLTDTKIYWKPNDK